MSAGDRVLVVGGGVIGLCCAYYLERAGFAVTVIDQGEVGMGCSHANCGYICPSDVLPLTKPEAIGIGIRSMFQPNAPFRITPRLDPALWAWLLQFARRCRRAPMIRTGHVLKTILDASARAYRELLATEDLDCGWRQDGLLYVFRTAKAWEGFARMDDLLAAEYGVRARRLDPAELRAFDPAFRPDLVGGFWYQDDASLTPEAFVRSLAARLRERGVELVEDCPTTVLRTEPGKIAAVGTKQGDRTADHYLLATGAWTAAWQKALRCPLPIQPGKGYSITLDRPAPSPFYPTLLPEHRVGITPLGDAVRLGSIMEFSGFDASLPEARLRLLRDSANLYVNEPFAAPARESWYGWRPMTCDSLPIIGPVPGLSNLTLAAGHNMLGMTLAPATGRLVADLISGAEPQIDPAPFRPNRFAG